MHDTITQNNLASPYCSQRKKSAYLQDAPARMEESDLIAMNQEMIHWLRGQQIQEVGHPHYGAIWYPTERRYDNRDTACSIPVFWRQYLATGEERYRQQADLARQYVLSVQEEDGGFAELTFDNKRMDEGSTVNTGMAMMALVRAFEAGYPCEQTDLAALSRMADFLLTLEWTPGGFYHDENHILKNSGLDCQNTTALAAASLCLVTRFLSAQNYPLKAEWQNALERAIKRLLEGQDASGQWPYRLGMIERYPCDMNHHGMLMLMVGELYRQYRDERLLSALVLGGQWLVEDAFLQTAHGTKHNWAFQKSACLYFTAGYFHTASALMQLAELDTGHQSYWDHHARELLRYVRTDLWHNPKHSEEGPFRLTEAGMAPGYAWHGQAMGWCAYLMDHILCDLAATKR